MIDDSQLSFSLSSVSRKKVAAVFDDCRLPSDSGIDAIDRTSGTRLPMWNDRFRGVKLFCHAEKWVSNAI
jgi:hypothetical protein